MTDTPHMPDYLKPALEKLDATRAAHLENGRLLDETLTAITRAKEQKAELEQENGSDASAWRTAFRTGGAVLTDELKNRHIERVARRELIQECENLAEVLAFESDRQKAVCNGSAGAYRQAHFAALSQYAEHELDTALRETCGALVRAMKIKTLALENPLANTTGHQGYIEPGQVVMQQVKSWLETELKGCHIRLTDEPVLYKTGLSAASLPHMDHRIAGTPASRQSWARKMADRETDLKARGLLS
ncbi:hypothetical protein [Vagococcus sp. WN89Y]|uniref:hypothetical protein n=1 Tax=Vagococcus sp. WN89Y TaxID=3457258 RepID=UPI003FCEC744